MYAMTFWTKGGKYSVIAEPNVSTIVLIRGIKLDAAVPTDDIQPMAHVLPVSNVFREDVVKESLSRELALSNAPLKDDGYFRVPKVLED